MLSCKEVSHLNAARFDRPLSLRERFQVWLHLKFCDACIRVFSQLKFMRETMEQYRVGPSRNEKRHKD